MRYKLLVFFIPIHLFIACSKKETSVINNSTAPPVPVDVIIAQKQSLLQEIETNGSVVANEFVELHPEGSGRLTYLHVSEGNLVQQGTIIAKINNADLYAQKARSESQLELALKTQERMASLLSVDGINQSEYDAVINQLNIIKGDISYTNALIEKTIIRAPFTGTIGLRQVSPGAYVTPASIISTLQQTGDLKIDFTIPEQYGMLLVRGNVVQVQLDGNTKIRKPAKIIAIEPQVDANTRNLRVRAKLLSGKANPGSFVKVYVQNNDRKSTYIVPSNAIIPEDRQKIVVVAKKGMAGFVPVETGERQSGGVEILSGINEGDSVVVAGVLFVRPGGAVKIKSVKNLGDLLK